MLELAGTSTFAMPKARATSTACIGPAPPKATRVHCRPSMPRSTVMRLNARTIAELATRTTPNAASRSPIPIAAASGESAWRADSMSSFSPLPAMRPGSI